MKINQDICKVLMGQTLGFIAYTMTETLQYGPKFSINSNTVCPKPFLTEIA